MVASRTGPAWCTCTGRSVPAGSSTSLPLQPNHRPPLLFRTSPSATARPPAAVLRGSAMRLETTTSRPIAVLDHGVPGSRQPDRRVDQAHHGIGLREVAPHLAGD